MTTKKFIRNAILPKVCKALAMSRKELRASQKLLDDKKVYEHIEVDKIGRFI